MNKTFKVVFSKTRNALMVVNEATSCVQAKGTKTVIATAVAATIATIANGALAAESTPARNAGAFINGTEYTISENNDKVTIKEVDGTLVVDAKEHESTGYGAITNLSGKTIGQVNISGGTFEANSARKGGAATIYQNGREGSLSNLSHLLDGVTFSGNSATDAGGAIAHLSNNFSLDGSTTYEKVNFSNNTATNKGGAIYAENTAINIKGSTFSGNKTTANSAKTGGGALYLTQNSRLNVEGSTFEGNTAALYGGAIYAESFGHNTIKDSTFTSNSASRGGAIAFWSDGKTGEQSFTVEGSTFSDNTAEAKGGAIAWLAMDNTDKNQVLTVTDTDFYNNTGTQGGAIFADDDFVVNGGQYQGNKAIAGNKGNDGNGGAIYAEATSTNSANFSITGATFTENQAAKNGGAVFAWADNKQVQDNSITNSKFTGNTAKKKGGAIAWLNLEEITDSNVHKVTVDASEFTSNQAEKGGAVFTESEMTVKNSQFSSNSATGEGADVGNGGAIYAWRSSDLTVTGSTFQVNSALGTGHPASGHGGAVMAWSDNNFDQNHTISNSQFINNKAANKGGAIAWLAYEPIHDTDTYSHTMTVEDSTFIGNEATSGGAIVSENVLNLKGENAFTGNKATEQGGALYVFNTGTVNIEGSATFSNNTAGESLNDIHNDGTVNVLGSLTLDGGITGSGTTNFGAESDLTVRVGFDQDESTLISNNVTIADGASLGFVFAPGYIGKYDLFTGQVEGQFDLDKENAVYNVTQNKDGTYQFESKSAEEISTSTGADRNQSRAIRAIMTAYSGDNAVFDIIAENVALGIQSSNASERQAALDAVSALSPEAAPMVVQTETDTATQVYSAVDSRLSATKNLEPKSHLWVQGLVDKGEYDDNGLARGYDSDSNGIAFGMDSAVTNAVRIGVGFAYTDTEIDGFLRDTDVESKTAFAYAQYRPSNWYINGILSYGWSSYDETKQILGTNVDADYDVETIGLQTMTGYDMEFATVNVTPEVGLRYFRISQDSYNDDAGNKVGSEDEDVLTAVVGAKVSKAWEVSPSVVIRPQARVAMTYDLIDADNQSSIVLANGATYHVEGETMDRFGAEVDIGVTADVTDNFEFALTYSGNFRSDFTNHAGMINAKYKF